MWERKTTHLRLEASEGRIGEALGHDGEAHSDPGDSVAQHLVRVVGREPREDRHSPEEQRAQVAPTPLLVERHPGVLCLPASTMSSSLKFKNQDSNEFPKLLG